MAVLTKKKSFNFLCEHTSSIDFSRTEYSEPCKCINSFQKVTRNNQDKEEKHQVTSTIKNIAQPYKEINVDINNNRLALRIQRYPITDPEKYDPPCECLEEALDHQKLPSSKTNEKPEKLLFKVVRPADDKKFNDTLQLTPRVVNFPGESDDPKNAYILRIRRRAETFEKKRENIDLEFRMS